MMPYEKNVIQAYHPIFENIRFSRIHRPTKINNVRRKPKIILTYSAESENNTYTKPLHTKHKQ